MTGNKILIFPLTQGDYTWPISVYPSLKETYVGHIISGERETNEGHIILVLCSKKNSNYLSYDFNKTTLNAIEIIDY